jgi:holliday junction DNA helicase RuvA
MIARLQGKLVERQEDGVVVDCAGVGYDVTTSMVTLAALPEVGAEVTLRVYTHVQETRIALYGFATGEERRLFDLLITVKNVGPATAVGILSGAPPRDLARLVAAGDVAQLVRIRGVGKKTADLIVVELKEKCEWLLATWGAGGADLPRAPGPAARPVRSPLLEDVTSALVNLGWRAAEVDKVVSQMPVSPGATVETLLREALRAMPR